MKIIAKDMTKEQFKIYESGYNEALNATTMYLTFLEEMKEDEELYYD
jgi:hypothetical protein